MINLYTDGSCSGNPGPGGYGYVLEYHDTRKFGADGAMHTTNSRMELMAVIAGLNAITDRTIPVKVYSDSEYVVKGMNEWLTTWKAKNWKNSRKDEVSNRDLWECLDKLVSKFKFVEFCWVRGHNGNYWNEYADELAREGTEVAKQ
ncbi:MAG: ribonuclease HI [Anaerolineales bacterium]